MEAILMTCSPSSYVVQFLHNRGTNPWRLSDSIFSFLEKPTSCSGLGRLVVSMATKRKKSDDHSFIPKPDEATGLFPEAVLLKKCSTRTWCGLYWWASRPSSWYLTWKVVKDDGRVAPEFADAEEEKLYEFLRLQLESDLNLERTRHYEVVYLIHEDHIEDVEVIVSKVQDFIRQKKGRIWRLNNWGLRRLAYKIRKTSKANYILMNFEIEAKWINDFKAMIDKDERIIRHLVMKQDKAVVEDCPPPPEFHAIKEAQGMDKDYDDAAVTAVDDEDDEDDGEDQNWLDDVEDDDGDAVSNVDRNGDVVDSEVIGVRKLKEKVAR